MASGIFGMMRQCNVIMRFLLARSDWWANHVGYSIFAVNAAAPRNFAHRSRSMGVLDFV